MVKNWSLLFYISNDKLTLIEFFYKLNSFLHKYIIYIRGACSKYCEAWSGGLLCTCMHRLTNVISPITVIEHSWQSSSRLPRHSIGTIAASSDIYGQIFHSLTLLDQELISYRLATEALLLPGHVFGTASQHTCATKNLRICDNFRHKLKKTYWF